MDEVAIVKLDPDHQGELIVKLQRNIADMLQSAEKEAVDLNFDGMREVHTFIITDLEYLVKVATNSCTSEDLDYIDCI